MQPQYIAAYIVDPKGPEGPAYLLLRRQSDVRLPGIWQIVTGKVTPQEDVCQAVRREIFEETANKPESLWSVDVTCFYDQYLQQIAFSANFCAYLSHKSNIVLNASEHDAYQWAPYTLASNILAFPTQKQSLAFIHHHYVLSHPHPYNAAKGDPGLASCSADTPG